jgi:hypothetical protein
MLKLTVSLVLAATLAACGGDNSSSGSVTKATEQKRDPTLVPELPQPEGPAPAPDTV